MTRVVNVHEAKTHLSRRPGAWRGRVVVAADFDETPDDLVATFRGDERLSKHMRAAVSVGANEVFVSAASAWEI